MTNVNTIIKQTAVYMTSAGIMLVLATSVAQGQERNWLRFGFASSGQGGAGSCLRCPDCDEEVCQLSCVTGHEKRFCFDVDHKTICVPKVKLPWQNCCEPRTAETKHVKILNMKQYKCPKCKCKWSVVAPTPPKYNEFSDQTTADGYYSGNQQEPWGINDATPPMPYPNPEHQKSGQPLQQVPMAPVNNGAQGSFHGDYFAPAKFGPKK